MELRKRLLSDTSPETERWLPIAELAEVSLSSEDPQHPIEHALTDGGTVGWRAGAPGAQTIRLHFDRPQDISVIHLEFEEAERERVHEFALQWADERGTFQPILRQQFSFSPAGARLQSEHYRVGLKGVTALELQMIPDISDHARIATLKALRIA